MTEIVSVHVSKYQAMANIGALRFIAIWNVISCGYHLEENSFMWVDSKIMIAVLSCCASQKIGFIIERLKTRIFSVSVMIADSVMLCNHRRTLSFWYNVMDATFIRCQELTQKTIFKQTFIGCGHLEFPGFQLRGWWLLFQQLRLDFRFSCCSLIGCE